jgi:hypothetical protein
VWGGQNWRGKEERRETLIREQETCPGLEKWTGGGRWVMEERECRNEGEQEGKKKGGRNLPNKYVPGFCI